MADLPLPAFAELLAYLPDGTEVTLFNWLPEQRQWSRMAGPRFRTLLAPLGGDRELFAVPDNAPARLVGAYQGGEYEAVADPPGEYRLLAKTRAARYPVETLARRDVRGTWRGQPCLIVGHDRDWARVRLIRPDVGTVTALGAQCVERCVYEVWAPSAELADVAPHNVPYDV